VGGKRQELRGIMISDSETDEEIISNPNPKIVWMATTFICGSWFAPSPFLGSCKVSLEHALPHIGGN